MSSTLDPPAAAAIGSPAFNIVLVRPEIPQNSGSVARLTAATRTRLHLVGPLGYSLADRYLKRAGLDYWPLVDLRSYDNWEAFDRLHRSEQATNFKYFSARGEKSYLDATYCHGDFLVFGSETKGLGADFLDTRRDATFRIPILEPGVRSLNLANAVSIVLYEALRQSGVITVS